MRWLPPARRPRNAPFVFLEFVGFLVLPWGIDFDDARWWVGAQCLRGGLFSAIAGPSRWRPTECWQLHYNRDVLCVLSGSLARQRRPRAATGRTPPLARGARIVHAIGMRTTPASFAAFALTLSLAACGSTPAQDASTGDSSIDDRSTPPMDSAPVDGAVPTDTGLATDTGVSTDAVTPDAITPDASAPGCRGPAPFDEGIPYARTLYVATSGNDTSGDGTDARPFATLRAAAMRAMPGTRILLRAGTYTGSAFLSNLRGTATQPIAIVGEGTVVLDAMRMGEALHISDPTWLVLENFTIRNSTINGLNIDDGGSAATPAHHVIMRRLRFDAVGSGGNNDCIKLSGLDQFQVLETDIASCNAGDAIDMVGCHDGFIARNRFHDTTGSGGVQAKGGSARVTIHGNIFENVRGRAINAGGSTGLEFFRPIDAPHEAAQLRVTSNVFIRPGANSGAAIAYVGCDACVFANNTVIEPQTWVVRILQETTAPRFVPSRNGLFVNNIVLFNRAALRTFINVGGNTAPATFVFGNNLWHSLDVPTFAGPVVSDEIPAEMGTIFQRDPMFANRAMQDFHINASSPAARAGRSVPGGVLGDYDGRCQGAPPSIGAFEPR